MEALHGYRSTGIGSHAPSTTVAASSALRQSRRSGAAAARAGDGHVAGAGGVEGPATTTPLRRISRGSLVALSASRTRESDLYGPTLGHLAPAFAELAEAVEDLAVNMEALDAINASLDEFNESFAGLLVGLRANAYTADFLQAPTARNFAHDKERRSRLEQQQQAEAALSEATRIAQEVEQAAEAERQQRASEDLGSEGAMADDTFVMQPGSYNRPASSRGGVTRGRGGRGRGTATAGAGNSRTTGQKQKDMLIKFAQPIILTMPIDFREKQPQRGDAETVIGALKTHPEGLRMQELVKMYPTIPQHRINDCLLALVRAKHAIKVTSKGLLYRLDPLKYPPGP